MKTQSTTLKIEGKEYQGWCICGNSLTYPDEYIDGVMCHACYIYEKDPTVSICDYCNFVDDSFFVFTDEDGDDEVVCIECIRSNEEYAFFNPTEDKVSSDLLPA